MTLSKLFIPLKTIYFSVLKVTTWNFKNWCVFIYLSKGELRLQIYGKNLLQLDHLNVSFFKPSPSKSPLASACHTRDLKPEWSKVRPIHLSVQLIIELSYHISKIRSVLFRFGFIKCRESNSHHPQFESKGHYHCATDTTWNFYQFML